MSIQSEIDRINSNVQSALNAVADTGVSVPEGANSDNLPAAVSALANEKQDKLTGAQGQIVGFGPDGKAVAQDKPTYAASEVGAIPTTEKGAANGVATLGADGKVPTGQLPSLDYIPSNQKGAANGVATLGEDGKVPESQLPSLGFKPQIVVTAPTGSTVTAMQGSKVYTASESSGTWTFKVEDYGTYTITATKDGKTATGEVIVEAVQQYAVELKYIRIYGVQWDGTSTTVWSRTDDAANFVNPTPYVSGASSYGSPFDDLYPWNGMVRVTDSEAGELVAIPKFWYKWTKIGNSLKLQIADKPADGFYTSPAHADRGDGKGERDVVYIGRYHCHTSNYKSQTGGKPKASITRSAARSGIHALGSTIWQSDIQLRMTIWMLYLVEFADWNTQKTIGKGCGNNSATQNMGYTDSMPYHTGTTKTSRDTYGLGTQYRNIEGLWDNVLDWGDGCYYKSNGLNIIMNPSNFRDSSGGTAVGVPSSGWPSAFTVATVAGLEWVIYPTATGGSESTYSSDYWNFYDSGPCLDFGGDSTQSGTRGLFCVYCNSASDSDAGIGCRLQKLP